MSIKIIDKLIIVNHLLHRYFPLVSATLPSYSPQTLPSSAPCNLIAQYDFTRDFNFSIVDMMCTLNYACCCYAKPLGVANPQGLA